MPDMYPLISVIVPVFNRANYIVETLDSILAESYPNKEIVLIDDGSTDRTDAVIKDWAENHKNDIQVVYKSRGNRGFVKTLNELVTMSNGAYIVFLGSDDYLMNDGIFKRYNYLKSNPDKLLVVGDCILVDATGKKMNDSAFVAIGNADKKLLATDAGIKKFMILNGYVPGATLMADKRTYEVLGLYDEKYYTEDWVYYIRAVSKDMMGFLDETVAAYRRHDGNACFSAKMVVTAKQQFGLTIELLPQFHGIFRLYMVLRLLYACVYIPYLTVKFKLLSLQNQSQQSHNKYYQYLIDSLFNVLLNGKNMFMGCFGLMFARRNLRS